MYGEEFWLMSGMPVSAWTSLEQADQNMDCQEVTIDDKNLKHRKKIRLWLQVVKVPVLGQFQAL